MSLYLLRKLSYVVHAVWKRVNMSFQKMKYILRVPTWSEHEKCYQSSNPNHINYLGYGFVGLSHGSFFRRWETSILSPSQPTVHPSASSPPPLTAPSNQLKINATLIVNIDQNGLQSFLFKRLFFYRHLLNSL